MGVCGRRLGGVQTLFRGRRLDIIYKVYLTLCPIVFFHYVSIVVN